MKKEIIIFGIGGHSKVVFDILKKQKEFEVVEFFSLSENTPSFLNYPHSNQLSFSTTKYETGIVAIGDNYQRAQVVAFIMKQKPRFKFISAIHPSSQISESVKIKNGTAIMANVAINSDTLIGEHAIINTGATIDHDCIVGGFSSIAPGCHLGGNVKIGEMSAISLGANIIHGKKIGNNSVVGAGSLVLHDLDDSVLAYGVPCKEVRKRAHDEKYL